MAHLFMWKTSVPTTQPEEEHLYCEALRCHLGSVAAHTACLLKQAIGLCVAQNRVKLVAHEEE